MRALALAAALAGCARDYGALAPFPCPADRRCPGGLACTPGVGCAAVQVDSFCDGTGVDCGAAAPDARCAAGVCERPCDGDGACPAGRVCSVPDGAGVCLVECTAGGSCPSGLACQPLWYRSRSACVAPGFMLPACAGVMTTDQCDVPPPGCGAQSFTVACAGGGFCAANSHCAGPNGSSATCECDSGYRALSCDGTACGNCAYPNWGCRADANPGCNDDLAAAVVVCTCVDGRTIQVGCSSGDTCEQRCRA